MNDSSKGVPLSQEFYQTQEELVTFRNKNKKLCIGIPNEAYREENRVCLTPQSVEVLVNNGHEIFLESGAGLASNYSDNDYSEKGCFIVEDKAEIYQCDIVLQLTPLSISEIELLKGRQVVLSALQLQNQSAENIRKMQQKKVTAIALEQIKDEDGFLPIIRSMSEITGISAIMIASEYLSKARKGKGVLLGGITGISPTEVVILGTGTAAEYAARAAIGLGAVVKVFDNSISQLRSLEERLGMRIFTSTFHSNALNKAMQSADVVIGALRLEKKYPEFMVSEEMVEGMKSGSIVIDLNIDRGRCFETSKMTSPQKPTYRIHDIVHYCVPNLPSNVSRTATLALSNICCPLLLDIGVNGGVDRYIRYNEGLRNGVYLFSGILTNTQLGGKLGILSKDINLLLAVM